MCGIVGIASTTSITDPDILLAMRDAMTHRGPDDAGIWWSPNGRVGLAHRRLSIIDLSPLGHQPMSDPSGRLWVTFNGEIYNYRRLRRELEVKGHGFRSASDTEVLLAAYSEWGLNCLERLNGMFAFAIYDGAARRLFLARDRAGEKPLFYMQSSGKLVFASELKALMQDPAFPRRLDLEAVSYYLCYGYVPGTMCMLSGVRKLGQGQAMTYELETEALRVWDYWQLPEPSRTEEVPAAELELELERLLEDSVRLRLEADVPVGILLSGGLDSSLVTAMAARLSAEPVKTFNVSFPGHQQYDEGPYARLVASYFGAEHTELVAEPASIELLPTLAQQFDEPMADSSMIPTFLVSRLIRQHATVALGGDGGDELFGGYKHYNWVQRREFIGRFVPRLVRAATGSVAARVFPVGFRGRNHLIGYAGDVNRSVAHVNMLFDRQARCRLLQDGLRDGGTRAPSPELFKASLAIKYDTPLQKATAVDFQTYLVDDILVKVDRASMLTSLEVRAPLLDHRIIEFAFSRIPDALKATRVERKILLRRLARRLLPRTLDLRRKQGFSIPLATWFRGSWGEYVQEVLSEAEAALFDKRAIYELISNQQRGYTNTQRLFALTMFELWRRHYRVSLPN